MTRLQDTQAEFLRFFRDKSSAGDHKNSSRGIEKSRARDMLLRVKISAVEPIKVQGDQSQIRAGRRV